MQVAQNLGSFFYTYTQCTKIEPCDQFVGKLGNNLQNSSDFSLRVREIEEKTTSFRFNYIHLRVGAAPTRRAHKELQTPAPCESTLAVEYGGYNLLLVSPTSTAQSRGYA